MEPLTLSVRPLEEKDIPLLINYWLNADETFLRGMGVEPKKVPTAEEWEKMLLEVIQAKPEKKNSYCILWLINQIPSGHSNINKIIFGKEAYMHLHLWYDSSRRKGFGSRFVAQTLPYFFKEYKLQRLLCEPFALNPAPNKILEQAGFIFEKEYTTTPGWLNFEQPVRRWCMTAEQFQQLYLPLQ